MGGYNEQIEAYLQGRLDPQTRHDLEARMARDADFRREVDRHRLLEAAKDRLVERELRARLQAKSATDRASLPGRRRWLWGIAAGIALLIFAGLYAYSAFTYSDQAIAGDFYIAPAGYTTRSADGAASDDLQEAVNDLATGDLAAAVDRLEAVPASSPRYAEARYFLAHAYFQRGAYREAEATFEQLQAMPTLPGYILPDALRVNRMLAQLGRGPSLPPDSLNVLQGLLNDLSNGQGDRLQRRMQTPWRRWVD